MLKSKKQCNSCTTLLVIFIGLMTLFKPGLCSAMQHFSGVASFNDFALQSATTCGPTSGRKGTYGAAAGDISPQISGGKCSGSVDMSLCRGQSPMAGYRPPQCPKCNCGTCYKVTNRGGHRGAKIGGIGKSIIAQIIDSCPSVHPENFCKTDMPAEERCTSKTMNQLDIDKTAYQALTGQDHGFAGPNLVVDISHVACPK